MKSHQVVSSYFLTKTIGCVACLVVYLFAKKSFKKDIFCLCLVRDLKVVGDLKLKVTL